MYLKAFRAQCTRSKDRLLCNMTFMHISYHIFMCICQSNPAHTWKAMICKHGQKAPTLLNYNNIYNDNIYLNCHEVLLVFIIYLIYIYYILNLCLFIFMSCCKLFIHTGFTSS